MMQGVCHLAHKVPDSEGRSRDMEGSNRNLYVQQVLTAGTLKTTSTASAQGMRAILLVNFPVVGYTLLVFVKTERWQRSRIGNSVLILPRSPKPLL